jgi:hypothetical protein
MGIMRIEGEPGQRLSTAYLWLTHDEASELRDAFDQMLAGADSRWHAHVSATDFQTEVTIALDTGP